MDRQEENIECKFSKIYRNHTWSGKSLSGPGSELARTRKYVKLVNTILADPKLHIQSVVELGCGDWMFSKTISWGDRKYTGIDIVPELVEQLNRTYHSDNRIFLCLDFLSSSPPAGDLLIIKDVLQHLSNDSVTRFISTCLPLYHYALITNDYSRYFVTLSGKILPEVTRFAVKNSDTHDGGSRPLELTATPFKLNARRILRYTNSWVANRTLYHYVKHSLFWTRIDA